MIMLRLLLFFITTIALNHHLHTIKAQRLLLPKHTYATIVKHSPVWYCGCAHVLADMQWLWLSHHTHELPHKLLFNYAHYITDLDGHFSVVYRYAIIQFLKHKQADFAENLLYKALQSEHDVDDWRLYLYGAYLYYFLKNDIVSTVQFLHRAIAQPKTFYELLKADRCAPPYFLQRWADKLKH